MRAQHGLKLRVCLDGDDLRRLLQKCQRERTDARADLQHALVTVELGQTADVLDHMVVDQEVLPQTVLGRQAKGLEQLARGRSARQR